MFLGRRQLLATHTVGRVAAILAALLAACKHTAQKSKVAPSPVPDEHDEPKATEFPAEHSQPESAIVCVSGPGNQLRLAGIPDAPERFQAEMKCYGSSQSALLVIHFPKYQHGDLQEVFIVDASGKLLAQRTINAYADVSVQKTLRPLLFDNLRLELGSRLGVVFYTAAGHFYKVIFAGGLAFEESFAGKKVYGLTPASVPSADFDRAQALPNFIAQVSEVDFLPGPAVNEQVFKASSSTRFGATEELKGYRITDLMGRELAEYGETFDELAEHPYFICYRLVETKTASFYLRSFVKIT